MTPEEQDNSLDELLATLRTGGLRLPGTGGGMHDHGTHDHGTHDHGTHDHSTHDHGAADGEPGVSTGVRTLHHGGHEVRIETRYRITVDGQPFTGHVEVLDDGRVHYHGLPNYAPASMTALMRFVLEHFGTELPEPDELAVEVSP